jgi:5-methylthioribose kinase
MVSATLPYHELGFDTVSAFAVPFLNGEPVAVDEIDEGNLNRVFRVRSEDSSIIVKQALPYLKVAGRSWPLTRHRARTENDAMAVHGALAPGLVTPVLHFSEPMSALVFEDLHDHQTWRDALIAGRDVPGAATDLGRYCAQVLLGTSDALLPSAKRKELRRRFQYSELCLVTEDLVFTAPYADSQSNRFDPEIAELARSLQSDRALRSAAAQLRFAFKTRDDALVHGDLHTGSVLVRDGDTRVIDLEFAFFGPIAFDPGLLLANLAFSRIAHAAIGELDFCATVDRAAADFWSTFAEECRRLWRPTEPWLAQFRGSMLADAARFAGMEMIRRVVGLAHVKDIDSLPQPARSDAQRSVVAGGRALILGPPCTDFDELWARATQEEKYE